MNDKSKTFMIKKTANHEKVIYNGIINSRYLHRVVEHQSCVTHPILTPKSLSCCL